MSDSEEQRIKDRLTGEWDTHPPKATKTDPDLAKVDPRDKLPMYRDFWIRKRRAAGLPDYPPAKEGDA